MTRPDIPKEYKNTHFVKSINGEWYLIPSTILEKGQESEYFDCFFLNKNEIWAPLKMTKSELGF